jgi:hypothetical protein
MTRSIEVSWLKRPGKGQETKVQREIGWDNLKRLERVCEQLPFTKNAHDITEGAAVGVAALLVSDLEGAILQSVLPIGSGGDYHVRVKEAKKPIQIEMSGLREDEAGSASRARLREKTDQVLTCARVGFVSVTTFSHGASKVVHNYLHYVRKQKKARAGKRKKP